MDKFDAAAAARDFLMRHGMYYEQIDPEKELKKFLAAMEADYRENGRTGRMIPNYIGDYRTPVEEKTVTVIDIGGTNVRSAKVTLGPHGLKQIQGLNSFLTPGVAEETDTAGFYGEVAEGVRDDLVSDEIGICFSLATIPQRNRDAVMVAGGKQIRIRDMLGRKVGESFRQAMAERGLERGQRMTVINDTVAAALGGRAAFCGTGTSDRTTYSSYIGFIYGTGINLCYREPTGEWINTETAAYCTFPTGDLDDAFDAGLIDPGGDRLEKMISGGYQGGLMTCILETAARENVISEVTWTAIRDAVSCRRASLSGADISAFTKDPAGDNMIANACADDRDREMIARICDLITERSARVCTVVLTAALIRSGAGRDPNAPVFITAEGSTYLKQADFKEKLMQNMNDFARNRHGLHFEIHNVPDVILRGIAVACLSE